MSDVAKMDDRKKAIAGMALAPLSGAYLTIWLLQIIENLFSSVAVSMPRSIGDILILISGPAVLAVIISPIFYTGMLFVGFPIFIMLRKTDHEHWWSYGLIAAMIGFMIPPLLGGSWWVSRGTNALGASLTLIAFWFISRRGVDVSYGKHNSKS